MVRIIYAKFKSNIQFKIELNSFPGIPHSCIHLLGLNFSPQIDLIATWLKAQQNIFTSVILCHKTTQMVYQRQGILKELCINKFDLTFFRRSGGSLSFSQHKLRCADYEFWVQGCRKMMVDSRLSTWLFIQCVTGCWQLNFRCPMEY